MKTRPHSVPRHILSTVWGKPLSRISPARATAIVVLALLFTLMAMQWSMRYGRLAQEATYDDVGYFEDSAARLAVFHQSGFLGLCKNLVASPPHSPFEAAAGMVAFSIFGLVDWAPYLINGLILLGYLYLVGRIAGSIRSAAFYALLIFALCIPFSYRAIHDFRPDFCVALITAAFIWVGSAAALSSPAGARRKAAIAGALFGSALWIKPSFFAHTLAMAALVVLIITALSIRRRGIVPGLRRAVAPAIRFLAIGLVVALPYYALAGREVVGYFVNVTKGPDSAIWTNREGIFSMLRMYTTSGGGAAMMNYFLWPALLFPCLAVILAIGKRKYMLAWLLCGYLAAAAASLSIIVYGRISHEYFGLPYQCLLALTMFSSVALIVQLLPKCWPLAPGLALAGLTFLQSPTVAAWHPAEEAARDNGWNTRIVIAIEQDRTQLQLPTNPTTFVAFGGNVGAASMRWIARQRNYSALQFTDEHRSGDEALQWESCRQAAYAVVATRFANSIYPWLPSAGTIDSTLAKITTSVDFHELPLSPEPDSAPYRVFRNDFFINEYLGNPITVSPPYPLVGFFPPEGPYPKLNLPTVRWAAFPEATIEVSTAKERSLILELLSGGVEPGVEVTVSLNGRVLAEHSYADTAFQPLTVPVAVSAGRNIIALQFRLRSGVVAPPGTRAMLFKRLSLYEKK